MKKNQVLITLDSLRYDVFEAAYLPFLKSFDYYKAYTQGTYTQPAHQSFFVGKLPTTFQGPFDNCAIMGRKPQGIQQWRLNNPESIRSAIFQLKGKNIIDGFNKLDYKTVGTGAMNWFDNSRPAHIEAIDSFKHYKFFGNISAKEQIEYVLNNISEKGKNYFAFINFGETHHTYRTSYSEIGTDYGNHKKCFNAQKQCIEYIDSYIKELVMNLKDVEIFICSDHGECMGEDGLWGHSFFHQKIIEVPILKIEK